jgi:DNA polymerase
MDDETIKINVKMWRAKSPNIVNFWYGIERAAVAAIKNPGQTFSCKGIRYCMCDGILYCYLPSGRYLSYHKAHIRPDVTPWGAPVDKIFFDGWNSNPKYGALGWTTTNTYGGKLVENIVQATSRDILADAMLRIEAAGYPIVMHIHDEIVSEVPTGFGSVSEYERIMADSPAWCKAWPIKADGGWRGMRYRK